MFASRIRVRPMSSGCSSNRAGHTAAGSSHKPMERHTMKLRHLTCAAFAAVSVLALPASASAASATLIADPSPLAFGAVRVDTSLQLQLVITNNGPDAVRLDNAPVFDSTGSGTTPVFRLTSAGTTCTIGGTLPVGSSCAQGVIFNPSVRATSTTRLS